MTRHVILGAGPAGVIAAETLRKQAPHDEIIIIGDEPEPPYSRMAIPYLLIGKVGEEGTYLRHDPHHFNRLRIELRRQRALKVDVANRELMLDDDTRLGFDTLLIATGSKPASPPVPGIHLPGVHTCWTLDDARHIARLAQPGARVLQMGAGFIGCIIMEALALRGVHLTVVEMGDRMVPRMMGPTAGGMIKEWVEKKGVQVYTGTRVEAIEEAPPPPAPSAGLFDVIAGFFGGGAPKAVAADAPAGPALRVRLSNGETLEADLVISATGVKPNIAFLEDSGIRCLQGVLTDEHMQTTVPGIYAAGDCAEAFDKVSGRTIVSAIQPNAADQAYVAAMNMAGRRAELKGVTQINVLDTLGLISASFGDWQGVDGGEHVELADREGFRLLSLQFDGDRLAGCNSVGWTEHVGVMRGLVEGRVRLGEWKERLAADPTRLMEAYLACAQAQERWHPAR
ncbi:NAD(P)/FAD-dependent oxidoreductase [Caldimonas tepidiphila]|uniref:NAD(P)/FAD-dependent oxidoreductase n=1 Tax=Caldimonas tepidiphila TaxID=2315841 RepID=UPI000E5BA4D0|nr:FAD-dependent oxidoreductase [Caldimonas tepidiphila]